MKLSKHIWKDEYELKVQILDDQHKKFITIINLLVDTINKKNVKNNMPQIFFKLMNHVENYFLQEEILLKKYPECDFENLQKDHLYFINRIAKFQNDFNEKGPNIASKLLEFLNYWLSDRIKTYNKNNIVYLQENDN